MAPRAEVIWNEQSSVQRLPLGGKEIVYATGKNITIPDGIELAFPEELVPLHLSLLTKIQSSELVEALGKATSVTLPPDMRIRVELARDATIVLVPDQAACVILDIFYRHHGDRMQIYPDKNCFNVVLDRLPIQDQSIPVSGFAVFLHQ